MWQQEHERASKALAQARAQLPRLEPEERQAAEYRQRAEEDAKDLIGKPPPGSAIDKAARQNAYEMVYGTGTRR